jgi:hypothetical protein
MVKDFLRLPSPEHRRHIRRFLRLPFNDEQDVALRAFTAFRIWLHKLTEEVEIDKFS